MKLFVILGCANVELVLCLRLWWLKGARQYCHLRITNDLGHLRMAKVLVHNDAIDQLRFLQFAAYLAFNLNEIEVDIPPLQGGHREHSVNANTSQLILAAAHYLGTQCGARCLQDRGLVVGLYVDSARNLLYLPDGHLASLFVACRDSKWVDALVKQTYGLLKEGPSNNDDSGSAVTDLVVLRFGQVHQKLGNVVLHIHFLQNCGAIIGNQDVTVRPNYHLVHALGPHGAANSLGNGLCSKDVGLVRLDTLQPLLLFLLLHDDEGVPVLINSHLASHWHRHGGRC
mmetsp:Transcript_53204/g.105673  ORF Transcript_53204/g.105673 Transcript_53204/m.105673 type:complete len:285 (+) Transcript_53204:842-1696(+)